MRRTRNGPRRGCHKEHGDVMAPGLADSLSLLADAAERRYGGAADRCWRAWNVQLAAAALAHIAPRNAYDTGPSNANGRRGGAGSAHQCHLWRSELAAHRLPAPMDCDHGDEGERMACDGGRCNRQARTRETLGCQMRARQPRPGST